MRVANAMKTAVVGALLVLAITVTAAAPVHRVKLGKQSQRASSRVLGSLASWWTGNSNGDGVVPLLNYLDAQVRAQGRWCAPVVRRHGVQRACERTQPQRSAPAPLLGTR